MSTLKKRRRSSLAPFKINITLKDSPSVGAGSTENEESDSSQKKNLVPNPENIAMDETIQMLEGQISKLQAEDTDRVNYLQQLDDKINEMERLSATSVETVKDFTMDDEMVSTYMYPMIDLDELSKQTNNAVKKSFILTVEHERTVDRLQKKSAEMQSKYDNVFKSLQDDGDQVKACPKRAVETISELPINTLDDTVS